ncbi:DNA-directed RNA polymerase subunit K [Candidatus Pacearchaeota archaeon]|nr:DNA-directed RNA polymerase subunit K [Candidatus Pacearchaeota archaeon]
MAEKQIYTNYEKARILGARALQVAMDAPLLMKISDEKLEEINYNPIEIAKTEFDSEVLPITVKKPMPKRKSVAIKKTAQKVESDKSIEDHEEKEEEEIVKEGEIMELANPEDEESFEEVSGREGSEELH